MHEVTFRDRIEAIKHSIDPAFVLDMLGFTVKPGSRELRGKCILHGGDNQTAFRYNVDRDTWVCFTHKCHETYGNDIIGLVMGIKKCSFMEAVQYLEEITGSNSSILYNEYKIKNDKMNFISLYRKRNYSKLLEEDLKCYSGKRSAYFDAHGFSSSTLDFFEIGGGYVDDYGVCRDVIPIRDVDGRLVGASYRDIREVSSDYKYIHSKFFDKDTVLYNLHNAKHHTTNAPLILVEGFKSVWRLHEIGVYNVAAVMGSSITSGQISLLYRYAPLGVVLFLDCDSAGVLGARRAIEKLSDRMAVYSIFITESGKDPADLDSVRLTEYVSGYY